MGKILVNRGEISPFLAAKCSSINYSRKEGRKEGKRS